MAKNLKQKLSRLFGKGTQVVQGKESEKTPVKQEPVSLEPAPLKVTPDTKAADVVEACVNFIKQNDGKLDFDYTTCMESDYDNVELYAMSQQKQSDYNYVKHCHDGKIIVGYYFSLELHKLSFDTMYQLRLPTGECFEFWKKHSKPELYQNVETLFDLLSKNYDKAEKRRKDERKRADQKELNDAVAYIKKQSGKDVTSETKTMTHIDLIKACQELVSSPSIMIIGKQDNMPLMKQKTFEIMPKSEYELPLIFNFERNIFYYNDSDGSHTRYDLCIGPEGLDVFSTKNKFYFEDNGQLDEIIVEAKKLFDLCESKQTVLEKPLKKKLATKVGEEVTKLPKVGEEVTKLPTETKIILFGAALGIGTAVFLPLVVALDQKNVVKTKEQVEKQVKTHDETLPNYLEQKQLFEQYRDSLTNSKIRQ